MEEHLLQLQEPFFLLQKLNIQLQERILQSQEVSFHLRVFPFYLQATLLKYAISPPPATAASICNHSPARGRLRRARPSLKSAISPVLAAAA